MTSTYNSRLAEAGLPTPVATASADAASFIDYLDRKGMDVSTADIRSASVELGIAIWEFGSVHFLCPQWEYLLPCGGARAAVNVVL